ncbi:MAG: hypothetical protein NXI24_16760 [bacterium]|nr:hypothetical protein [bacterium]
MDPLRIDTYNTELTDRIEKGLTEVTNESWLSDYVPQIFQICDELIKNALKSNYKFLLMWSATRDRLQAANPGCSERELRDWLQEIFFSGEDRLIEQHLAYIADQAERIRREVRRLLDLENRYLRAGRLPEDPLQAGSIADEAPDAPPEMEPLLRIKRLARDLNIHAHIEIERSPNQLLVTIANDSPILAEDVQRIAGVRRKFREYRDSNRQQEFFIENLDTSGGGHGLGYAIMDSILCEMNLDPMRSLYLISATRTLVLLALPLIEGGSVGAVNQSAPAATEDESTRP